MNLADIRKRHGLDEKKTEQKNTTQTTASHMLDEIRARHNLGKVTSTREKVEEAKAAPRLYKNEAEYYAANARPYDEVKAELDAVTKRRNTYDNEKAMRDSGISGRVWQKRYGEKNTERINELARMIEMENKRIDSLTKEAQYGRLKGYNDLANSEDFDAKSMYDKNAKATVANQLYRQVNNPDLPLTNEEYSDATREITRQMTADEVKIFNYIYNTQGDKAAQEYFDYLKTDAPDPLNSRRGKEIAGNIDTDVGRAIYGGIAAVDNTTQGVKQLFTSEAVKPTVAQYASAQAAEDVETKVGKFAYDLSATVGNMAPSILASTLVGVVNPLLGKAVGSTLMGAASAGNTYTDAINSGMTPRQAMKYGAMVGASEAALESVLGGISKLGANPIGKAAGKLVSGGKFAKAIGAVDNAFIRAAAKLAGSMAGEIAEEELQLFLEPLFKTMATDEKYDAPEWEEIVYTALISAASAGLFEAPGNIAEAVAESRQKKAEKIIRDAIEQQTAQSKTEQTVQGATDAANADFANKVSAENAQQTANDTAEEKAAEIGRKGAYSEMVSNYADSMDAAGQNVFIEAYDGSVEPDVYVREMQDAYDAGRRGESLAASETAIGDDRRQLAYKAGEADRVTEQADYGFVHNEVSRTVDRKLVQNLNRIGKDLKVKIQFVDSVRGGAAQGSYRNGVVTISRRADDPYMVVAKHEITHHLEKVAPKAYAAYQAYAVETVAKGYGKTVDALVQDRIAVAARHGDRLTAAEARAEIAADFTELIFADEKNLRQFVEANSKSAEGRNMLQRLWDAVRRFIASLKKTKVSIDAEAARKLKLDGVIARLEQAEMLLREALKEGGQQRTGVSGDGGKTMYALRTVNGITYIEADKSIFRRDDGSELSQREVFDALEGTVIPLPDGNVKIIKRLPDKDMYNELFRRYPKNNLNNSHLTKQLNKEVNKNMVELLANSTMKSPRDSDADNRHKKQGITHFDTRTVKFYDGEKAYNIDFSVGILENGEKVAYAKKYYGYDAELTKKIQTAEATSEKSRLNQQPVSKGRIPQPGTSVKSKLSTKGGGLDALRKQYGEIEPGENPTRDAHVPRKTEKHKNVSQTVRTIIEAGATPDYIVPAIEELIEDGTVSFETVTDEHAYKVAKGKVKAGYTQAWNDWFKAVNQGKVSKELTATGWALYDYAVANKNDFSEALEILVAMAGHQRNAAQALQATRILKRMTPEGKLATAQRAAKKLEEEANKKYTDSTAGRKAKEQAAETDDAVTEARKGAARKAANNFKKAAEDGEYESVPFVFEYAQKVGEAVASAITREAAEGQRTTMEIITNQLIKFAREKVPNAARKSKGDILVDLVNNYEFYAKAYKWAQNEVAREYGEDERFEEFLDTPIGTDADSYAGRIIGRSIADALVGVGETKKIIREKAALGFGEVFKTVGDYLVEKTGAKGRAENMLRNAAAAYVTDIILTNPKSDAETVNKLIREVIRDTGVKLSDTIRKGDDALTELKTAVVSTLTAKYNLPAPYAKQAVGIIEKQFEQMAREEAAKELDRRFKEKKIVTPKTQREILTELAQLGAFKMDSRYNAQAVERLFRTGYTNIKIDQVLAERLLTATSEKARDEALHDIYRDIGRQTPPTFLDKWNAWRYCAMLCNVRTHVRNFVGNAAFVPLVGVKNAVATGLEKAAYTFGGQRLQRTKGIPTKELLAAAYKDYSNLTDKELAGEKYNDNANANAWIEEGRQIFGQKTKVGKVAEALRKGNSALLSKGDEWFVKPHYALALAQYCKANGITAQMIAAGKGLDGARQYAIKEAQKATYRDANAVSEAVSKFGKYKGDNVVLKAGSLFVDAVLPFRKTPANILVRAVEYSPVGLIKSITADLVRMKQGKINGAQVIDNLAAGLTGTALMGLGVLLSKLGLVIGMGSDDEDERKFNELQGYQGYAIVFDDRTYTVDWLAPEAMPFFVGVNLAELKAFEEANISEMSSALTNITAPMLEMSCLQGLNDMIESAGSVQGKGVSAWMRMVSNAATSYLTQALPTLFGQVERVTEKNRQQTYTDKSNKVLTPNMQYTLGKAFNKLPGDVAQIPYIDAWGRETETGNVGVRAFNNLLNPGYSARIRTSEMEKELQRLFDETGEKSVLPDRAAKYITVEGEKIDLNKNQYVKYATVKGQTAYDMLTKITASSQYKALDEQSKVDLIGKVYSYANAIAKAEVTKTQKDKALRYQPDGWIEKAVDTSKATGIPAWKYVLIYNGQPGIGVKDEKGETIPLSPSLVLMEYLYSFIGLSDAQRQALYADFGVAKSVRHYDRQRVAQELKKMRAK